MTSTPQFNSNIFPHSTLASWADYMAQLNSATAANASSNDNSNSYSNSSNQTDADAKAAPYPWSNKIYTIGETFQHGEHKPEMCVLPSGTFWMGAHPLDPDATSSEKPRHQITIPQAFAISTTPITFTQWDTCHAAGGTQYQPADSTWGRGMQPVINVNWFDAEEYIHWLRQETGENYRLLTEAEWEYACWAGCEQTAAYPWGQDLGHRQLRHHAWSANNSGYKPQPVATKQPNAFGLFDMLGNVAEWVADHHTADYHSRPQTATAHRTNQRHASCTVRGGSWLDAPPQLRPSARTRHQPEHRAYNIGFRVAMDISANQPT